MTDSNECVSRGDILAVFMEMVDAGEPLATKEVADAVGCDVGKARDTLDALTEAGDLRRRQLDEGTRVWWRPGGANASEEFEPARTPEGPDTSATPTSDAADPRTARPDRELIERILEASPVSIVVVEPSGEISFANRRAEETLGLDGETITSRTYRQPEWNIHHADGTPVSADEHPVTKVLETRAPDYGFEHWIELPDGTERWLSSNSAPVLTESGAVEYVVVGFEDATPLKEREDKLTSDERRTLELHSAQLFEPFLEAAAGDVRVDVDEVVALPDGGGLQYLSATGIPAKSLVEVFEQGVPAAGDVRLLRSQGAVTAIEVWVEDTSLPLVFEDLGGQVRTLVRTGSAEPRLVGELPGDVDPRAVITAARKLYPDIRLESQTLQYSPKLLADIVEDDLTDRQFAALQTAYYGGYFATPRSSTGEELADRLDITRQTFNQHLRKAERAVLQQLFEASAKEGR